MDYIEVAKRLYPPPDWCKGEFYATSGYQPIIDHIGEVAIQVDDDNYQGDTRVLYRHAETGIGYLKFGWGSCSGCDALQACDSWKEAAKLIKEMEASVQWKPAIEMLRFFKEHDWAGDYDRSDEQTQFIAEATAYMEGIAKQEES